MKLTLHTYTLPLRHEFRIARGAITEQRTLIVQLEQDGISGFGEATANRYYNVTVESSSAALESVRAVLDRTSLTTPEALWHSLDPVLHPTPFAQCALDEAAHDLWGKLHHQPVWQLWGHAQPTGPLSSFTIAIASIADMVAHLREVPDWPTYKIKLGSDDDLGRVHALRAATSAPFRLDANCGWTLPQTLAQAKALQAYNVEFIEQPMPADAWDAMRTAHAQAPLPLVADESCCREPDVQRCVGHFAGINVKLMKCGGLTPARRMLQQARQLGLKTMVGCMTESTVGISSIAQLLPLVDWVDIDGAALLQKDTAQGVRVERGRAVFPSTPGCGVTLL